MLKLKMLFRAAIGLSAILATPAWAAPTVIVPSYVQAGAMMCVDSTGALTGCAGSKQEAFQLVSANVAASAVTVYGGDYILAQTCTAYGTLALTVLGPDGATYQTIVSKTVTDSTGGTGLALGSNATVKITITGTTGCNASLTRVP